MTKGEIRRILCNPFYAVEIAPVLALPHPLMVTEEDWVGSNAKLIAEIGAKAWLRELLVVLKGGYVTTPAPSVDPKPRRVPKKTKARSSSSRRRKP